MTYASFSSAIAHASLPLEYSQIGDTYILVLLAVSVVTAVQKGSTSLLREVCEGKQRLSFGSDIVHSFFKMFSSLYKEKRSLFRSPTGKTVGHPVDLH